MSWTLSRFRAGELVEVRSKEEILATLDEHGCVDGLPFMPEMLQLCGQRIPVRAVAHKTCETAFHTAQGRRLDSAVHFGRCDGSAHGGCQAACSLFWKDAWLRPAGSAGPAQRSAAAGCSEERLRALTEQVDQNGKPVYACQATQIFGATRPLAWWDVRQYVFDVRSRNQSLARVLRVGWLATLRNLARRLERIRGARGASRRFGDLMHRLLTGRSMPALFASSKPLAKTPSGRLELKPGEWVRIRPQAEIEQTLDETGRNRGLSFDAEEMAPFCGGTYRVWRSVTQIVDEATGEMRRMKEPCIILEGVACRAEYARCRLNCPRAFYSYWRELWLERVDAEAAD
ncbi:MAG TPA: hypothetical protein VEI82_13000 [Myxococcota bacterium]|nr:hypothetical protein [Myxococcota bacterium]